MDHLTNSRPRQGINFSLAAIFNTLSRDIGGVARFLVRTKQVNDNPVEGDELPDLFRKALVYFFDVQRRADDSPDLGHDPVFFSQTPRFFLTPSGSLLGPHTRTDVFVDSPLA